MMEILHKYGRNKTGKFFRRRERKSIDRPYGVKNAMGQQALAGEIGIQAQGIGDFRGTCKITEKQHQIGKEK